MAGSTSLSFITLDLDGGTAGTPPQMLADDFTVNGAVFSAGAAPEPATWALMLLGLGAIGGAMRLSRRRGGAAVAAA